MSEGSDTLRVFDFGLLFQALAQSLKVGVLKVSGRQGEKYLHFSRGRLKAVYTKRTRIRLGRILYNMRVVEQADLQRVLEAQAAGQVSLPLGEELLARGIITGEELAAAVKYQMTEELLEIFYWREYSYEFHGGPLGKMLRELEPEHVRVGGDQDVQELLLTVSRIVDEITRFNQVTPSLRDVYELAVDPEAHLVAEGHPPELVELLGLIDGCRDLKEILKEIRLNRFEVMGLLCRLRTEGVIRPKNAFELLMLAENRRGSLSAERLARLYERVRELGVEGFDVTERLAQVREETGDRRRAAELYVEHARSSLEAGDACAAGRSAKRASELFPDDTAYRELVVQTLLRCGEREEAARELAALAGHLAARGDANGEYEALSRAREVGSADSTILERLGRAAARLGRRRVAAAAFARLGKTAVDAGEPERALRMLGEAAAMFPESGVFRWQLVEGLARAGLRAEAGAEAVRAVVAVRDRCSARGRGPGGRRLALLALERRARRTGVAGPALAAEVAEALAACGDAAGGRALLAGAAEAERAAGRAAECRRLLERARTLDPDDPALGVALAETLAEQGEVPGAVRLRRELARWHEERGEVAKAEEQWRRILEIAPVSPPDLLELAASLGRQGRQREAAVLYARVGTLYRAAGAGAEAAEWLDRACRLDPGEPEHLRALVDVLEETLQADRSAGFLERLVGLLRERGEHASALDAGFRLFALGAGDDDLERNLRESWLALGRRLEELRSVAGRDTAVAGRPRR